MKTGLAFQLPSARLSASDLPLAKCVAMDISNKQAALATLQDDACHGYCIDFGSSGPKVAYCPRVLGNHPFVIGKPWGKSGFPGAFAAFTSGSKGDDMRFSDAIKTLFNAFEQNILWFMGLTGGSGDSKMVAKMVTIKALPRTAYYRTSVASESMPISLISKKMAARNLFICGATAGNRFQRTLALQGTGWEKFCKMLGELNFDEAVCKAVCHVYPGTEEARLEFNMFRSEKKVSAYGGIGGASFQLRIPVESPMPELKGGDTWTGWPPRQPDQKFGACVKPDFNFNAAGVGHGHGEEDVSALDAARFDLCSKPPTNDPLFVPGIQCIQSWQTLKQFDSPKLSPAIFLSFLSDSEGSHADTRIVGGMDETNVRFGKILVGQGLWAKLVAYFEEGNEVGMAAVELLDDIVELTVWQDSDWQQFVKALQPKDKCYKFTAEQFGFIGNAHRGIKLATKIYKAANDASEHDEWEQYQVLAKGVLKKCQDTVPPENLNPADLEKDGFPGFTDEHNRRGWDCFQTLYHFGWVSTLFGYVPRDGVHVSSLQLTKQESEKPTRQDEERNKYDFKQDCMGVNWPTLLARDKFVQADGDWIVGACLEKFGPSIYENGKIMLENNPEWEHRIKSDKFCE